MKKIQIALLFLNLVFQTALAQEGKNISENVDPVWLKLENSNYEIHYPEDWLIDESGQLGTSFILFSPLSDEDDKFKENVNMLVQDLSGQKLSLDEYVELSENQIRTLVTDGELVESKRIIDGSTEFHRLIYTGKQGIYDLKFEQFYWVSGVTAEVLTFTAERSQFDAYQATGEQILSSYRSKN